MTELLKNFTETDIKIPNSESDWPNTTIKFLTLIGYVISSMAISVHVFVHFTTDLFRNFPGNLLMSNCVLLFLQYFFSMFVLLFDNGEKFDRESLKKYDYYVTVYIWSVLTRVQFAMAFDLWRCLKKETTNVRLSRQQILKFVKYSAACWLSPLLEWAVLWMAVNFIYHRYPQLELNSANTLWTTFMIFYLSDFALMLANLALYVSCLFLIYRIKSSVRSASRRNNSFTFYFKICGRLFVMSEVNYTLLIFADHFHFQILRMVFTNFMAYHGAVVFATMIMKKSIVKYRSFKADVENTAVTMNVTGCE